MQEDIKVDLALSDSQLGTLVLAFGIMHALFAIPIGFLADNKPRKTILAICLAVWSSFTALGGAVTSYVQLLIVRLGVGMGEAGVTPTSYSLISDKFPINKRASALAIIAIGLSIGSMLSLVLGGRLADALGWRWTFVIFGLPGVLLAIVFMSTVEAPKRGESDKIITTRKANFGETFSFLFGSKSFDMVLLGAMCSGVAGYSVLSWIPSYYIREFDMTKTEVGLAYGLVIGITGVISLLAASALADKLGERDLRWYAWLIGAALLITAPFMYMGVTVDTFDTSIILVAIGTFFGTSTLAITNSLIQNTSPVHMRGVASAIKTTVMSFIGYGLGGAAVGWLSDYFSDGSGAGGLQKALAVVISFYAISGVIFLLSAFSLRNDIERALIASRDVDSL